MRSSTVLDAFVKAKETYGVPSRVRADYGSEDVAVERFMNSVRGEGRGSHIKGKSVYNQRVERMHRDITRCVSSTYIDIFSFLEETASLIVITTSISFAFILLLRINRSLGEFQQGWNFHGTSTEGNKTPFIMWIESIVDPVNEPRIALQDLLNEDALVLDSDVPNSPDEEESDDDYDLPNIANPLTAKSTAELEASVNPLDEDKNYGVENYLKVLFMVLEVLNADKKQKKSE